MGLSAIFSTIGTVVSGGITGLIGTAISTFMKYKVMKLKFEHEKEMKQIEIEQAKTEAELQIKITEAKVKGEIQKGDQEIYKKSYDYMNEPLFKESYFDKLPKWVQAFAGIVDIAIDAFRASIRPTLTVTFTVLTGWLVFATFKSNPAGFVASTTDIVSTILYLTVTIVTWWFGNRDSEKFVRDIIKNKGAY